MAKNKRQKSYESAGIQFGRGSNWYYPPVPPKLRKKDVLRKMIQDQHRK